jgi:Secretion system C-terminal sorting domain
MIKQISLFLLANIFSFVVVAQENVVKTINIQPIYSGEADMESDNLEFLPSITHIMQEPKEIDNEENEATIIEKTKQKIAYLKLNNLIPIDKKTRTPDPIVKKSWQANNGTGTPPDNAIAVNTLGQIVSMVNSNIIFYTDKGVPLYNKSMPFFFKTFLVPGQLAGTSADQCDPKVLFDCESKRFIAFSMTCTGISTSSRIMIAVSKEEDPTKGWYTYVYNADPLTYSIWFDYPRLGINGSDIFITGNMFNNNGNFVDGVLYQIDKVACYAGNASPKTLFNYNLSKFAFSMTHANEALCFGALPDVHYIVSSKSGGGNDNRICLYTITGKAIDALPPVVTSEYITTSLNYSLPGYGVQKGTNIYLNTNDCRMQDAYYLDGTIHCVFQYDAGGGFSGIHYSRLKKNGAVWACTSTKISATGVDYSFPTIANYANNSHSGNMQTSIIGFLATSTTEYPNMKAVVADETMVLSNKVTIKSGSNFVDYGRDTVSAFVITRWGDYIGIGRQHYTAFPTVWISGMYGDILNTDNSWSNEIVKLTNGPDYPTTIEKFTENEPKSLIYPNPITNQFCTMEIMAKESKMIDILLYDNAGKMILNLLHTNLFTGKNNFQFNTSSLANGVYQVQIKADNKTIETKQLIIQK